MKYLLSILIILFIGCKTIHCYEFKDRHKTLNISSFSPHLKSFQIIDMGGWSSVNEYQFINNLVKETSCSSVKERVTKDAYKNCFVTLTLNSNNDTGNDRIRIFCDKLCVYSTDFGYDGDTKIKFILRFEKPYKLRFVVDNRLYNTPGAFQATIKIKEIR